jgi:hypothetical protein
MEQFANNNHQAPVITYDQNNYFGDNCLETGNYVANNNNNAQIGCIDWSSSFATSPFMNGLPYSFPDSQSDGGDITPH